MGQASRAKIEIRRFLKDCGTCGTAKGYLHLPGQERSVRVACRCESGKCPRCGRQLIIAPSPIVADDMGGRNWEAGLIRARCAACGPMFV
jgi:hypothetical protein